MKDAERELASLYNSISSKWVDMCSDLSSPSLQREHVRVRPPADTHLILAAPLLRGAGDSCGMDVAREDAMRCGASVANFGGLNKEVIVLGPKKKQSPTVWAHFLSSA